MNTARLRDTVHQHIANGEFKLPTNTLVLESQAIDDVLGKTLGGEDLIILNPQEAPTADGVTVSGKSGNQVFKDKDVQATFGLDGQTAKLTLTVDLTGPTPGGVWHLPDSFPAVQNSILDALQFVAPSGFTLTSYDASPDVKQGLHFSGTLNVASGLELLAFLLGESDTRVTGRIDVNHGVPEMVLTGTLATDVPLGFVTLPTVTIGVHSSATYNRRMKAYVADAFIAFNTSIDFTAGGETHPLRLSADVYNPDSDIQFALDITGGLAAGLDEIAKLAKDSPLGTLLPSSGFDFHLENVLTLTSVRFQVNPSGDTKLVAVKLEVQTTQPWHLVKDSSGKPILSIERIALLFRIDAPFGAANAQLTLVGLMDVGHEGKLEIVGSYPGWEFRGGLQSGTSVRFAEIFALFSGSTDVHLPDMDVRYTELVIQPGVTYSFGIGLEGSWPITVGELTLTIESMHLALRYDQGSGFSASVGGAFGVAGVDVTLEADYDAAAKGWKFAGKTGEDQPIHIDSLIDDIEFLFDVELPQFLHDLVLENLGLEYDTGSGDFTFKCTAKFAVDDVPVDADIAIEIKKAADGTYTRDLSGHVLVSTLAFLLHFLQQTAAQGVADDSFVATFSPTGAAQGLNIKTLVTYVSSTAGNFVPDGLKIDLRDVLLGYHKGAAGSAFLFGLDLDVTHVPALSNLPLVGSLLPADQRIDVQELRVLVASQVVQTDVLSKFNGLLQGSGVKPVPADTALGQGPSAAVVLSFGGAPRTLSTPVSGGAQQPQAAPQPATPPAGVTPSSSGT
jgi:hypothetical protein